jgi:N-acetylglutamate synthase-like GNAT family acetyltransferase
MVFHQTPIMPSIEKFQIRAASLADLSWISELQQRLYSSADAVPLAKLQEWFSRNPRGFFILENHRKEPIGQITFLFLKQDCLTRYQKEGEQGLIEAEICGIDLHGPGEMEGTSSIYLESIILPEEDRRPAQQALLLAFPQMIDSIHKDLPGGKIFALAATPAGERWLARMGFFKISRAEARRDGHDLYESDLAVFLDQARAKALGGNPA